MSRRQSKGGNWRGIEAISITGNRPHNGKPSRPLGSCLAVNTTAVLSPERSHR
jgi:hypothetical protein